MRLSNTKSSFVGLPDIEKNKHKNIALSDTFSININTILYLILQFGVFQGGIFESGSPSLTEI